MSNRIDMSFEKELINIIPELRLFARSRTCRQADADDLVQKTLLRALEKMHLFKGGKLIAWAITMMKNIRIDDIRKVHDSKFTEIDENTITAPQSEPMQINDVNDALQKLGEKCREVLIMSAGGYSYQEICETLLIKKGTVMSRLARCREQLIEVMQ